jgi:phosphomannomutase
VKIISAGKLCYISIMQFTIHELMSTSGVAFGTSGARGLAAAMTDLVCYAYTKGFLQHLESIGEIKRAGEFVAVAGDFRPSTDRVMEAVCRAADDMGYRAVNCGKIPSPAVALFGLEQEIPAIMVTGSHIPDDRNGIKFNKATGEALKGDEQAMAGQSVMLNDALFDSSGWFVKQNISPRTIANDAGDKYVSRYLNAFERDVLKGMRVGVYQHSAVGRDGLVKILSGLGAEVTPLGRSEQFIPVDTEAIRPEDVQLARAWASSGKFDALVSTDGDSDRPIVSDERGEWLRGDVAGILCARFLGADSVSTPVSCNTAVDKCGWFATVRRTRIGSPYVIASMLEASRAGAKTIVGYEANGGFLLYSDVTLGGKHLRALPTRDAVIVMLGILLTAKRRGKKVSELVAELPARFTASDRLKNFPTENGRAILGKLATNNEAADCANLERLFGTLSGKVSHLDRTDGLRVTFANEEVIHLRPSGNAPEFRCYIEAASRARAIALNGSVLDLLRQLAAKLRTMNSDSQQIIQARMRAGGVAEPAINAFLAAVAKVAAGGRGQIPESEIEPVAELPELESLPQASGLGGQLLNQLAVIKLNGGLGTSMGLERAKSLIAVKGGERFLDLIAKQVLHLRAGSGAPQLVFYLMNSYNTQADTLAYLKKYPALATDGELDFLQSKVPKLDASTLLPVSWPAQPDLEWCPPGHGDLYPSLLGCGLLDKLLARGIRFLFVSNSDNLGAQVDSRLLHHFAASGSSFLMEVAPRTAADRKGGHLARRRADGRLLLREAAQCLAENEDDFQNIERHRFFNTNNLWIRLDHLKAELDWRGGILPLALITNVKNVDPCDATSPKVIQIESAMGAAIECFPHTGAVVVPRSRFAPVKSTGDLLALRSDAYRLTDDCQLVLDESRHGQPPVIDLDSKHYKLLSDFEAAFPHGAVSLIRCESLKVRGKMVFPEQLKCRGKVEIINASGETRRVRSGVMADGAFYVE